MTRTTSYLLITALVFSTVALISGHHKAEAGTRQLAVAAKYTKQVKKWRPTVKQVLREHGYSPKKFTKGVLKQINQESGGNRFAVNRWDSNWRAGIPSKGLLQTIEPTFKTYCKRGYCKSYHITRGYANLWAAINYVKHRYGKAKLHAWNRGENHGY